MDREPLVSCFQVRLLDFRWQNPNLRPGTIESRIRNRETRVTPVTLVLSGDYRHVLFKKRPDFFVLFFNQRKVNLDWLQKSFTSVWSFRVCKCFEILGRHLCHNTEPWSRWRHLGSHSEWPEVTQNWSPSLSYPCSSPSYWICWVMRKYFENVLSYLGWRDLGVWFGKCCDMT